MNRRSLLGAITAAAIAGSGCLHAEQNNGTAENYLSPSDVSNARIKSCEEIYIEEDVEESRQSENEVVPGTPTVSILSKERYNDEWVSVRVDSSWPSKGVGLTKLSVRPVDSSTEPGTAVTSTEESFSDFDAFQKTLSAVAEDDEEKAIHSDHDQYERIIDSLVTEFGDDVKRGSNEMEGQTVVIKHDGELLEVQEVVSAASSIDRMIKPMYFVSESELYRGEDGQKPTEGTLMDC